MKRTLNLTIDESGDFGAFQRHSPYYLVAMLFHDSRNDIEYATQLLDNQIRNLGHEIHSLHTGPIIRREGNYQNLSVDERKRLLNALIHFSRRIDVQYTVLSIEKRECRDTIELISRISKRIQAFLDKHSDFFYSFDEINVYYDNGQIELTRILTSTFSVLLPNVTFHRVMPNAARRSLYICSWVSIMTSLNLSMQTAEFLSSNDSSDFLVRASYPGILLYT